MRLLKPIQLSAMPASSGLHIRRTDANGSKALTIVTANSGITCNTVLLPISAMASGARTHFGKNVVMGP